MRREKIVLICVLIGVCINAGTEQDKTDPYFETSPIDIVHYTSDSTVKYPANPHVILNSTLYYPLNDKAFTYNNNTSELSLDASEMGNAYVIIYNKTYTYKAEKIALKVYAEHSFNGVCADLEFQIYHKIIGNLPLAKELGEFDLPEDFINFVISVRFSANKDKTSKNKAIRQLTKVSQDQDYTPETLLAAHIFDRVSDIDFNRYTNFDDPYYLYKGTSSLDDSTTTTKRMYWAVMHNVNYMDIEELENVQLALYKLSGRTTNARGTYCSTRKGDAKDGKVWKLRDNCKEDLIIYYQHPKKDKKSK